MLREKLEVRHILELLADVVSDHHEAAWPEHVGKTVARLLEVRKVMDDIREEDHACRSTTQRNRLGIGEAERNVMMSRADLGEHLRRPVEPYDT